MGVAVDRVAKTIVLAHAGKTPEHRVAGTTAAYAFVCLPGSRKINLTVAAQNLRWSGCQRAETTELLEVFGIRPGAVSPIGLGDFPVIIVDRGLLSFPTVFVGSGAIGVDIELDPRDLVMLTKATVCAVANG